VPTRTHRANPYWGDLAPNPRGAVIGNGCETATGSNYWGTRREAGVGGTATRVQSALSIEYLAGII